MAQKYPHSKNINPVIAAQHSLWILPLQETAKPKLIGNTVSFKSAWSPNGRYIVFIGIQRVSELREEAATAIYDSVADKSWFISSPDFKSWISVPTSRYKSARVIVMIDPTLYTDLIWINNEIIAYTIALNSGDKTKPNMILYSIRIDGTGRQQIFP